MLKLPFKTLFNPTVTQEFGNTSNNTWYLNNGINIPFHNGADFTFGTPIQTSGTGCVCPFKKAKVVKVSWDAPNSTKGNGVTIEGDYNGKKYQVVFWHTNEIIVKLNQELVEGDVVCYVGNSGLCNPRPTADYPYNGSHCHLMIFEYVFVTKPNGSQWELQEVNNGVGGATNPRLLFNYYDWFKSFKDSGNEHDVWAVLPFAKFQKDIVAWFKKIGLIK